MSDDISYQSYWKTVTSLAQVVHRVDAQDGEAFDLYGAVFAVVDGNYWVIYTHAAGRTLQYSDHADAYFDDGMDVADLGGTYDQVVTRMAHFAMIADVTERYWRMLEGGHDAA